MIKYILCVVLGVLIGLALAQLISRAKVVKSLAAEVPLTAVQTEREEPADNKWEEEILRQVRNMWRYDGTEEGQEDKA